VALPLRTECSLWPVAPAQGCCTEESEAADPDVRDFARKVAQSLLDAATGWRFGPSCPVTVRPCRRDCADVSPFPYSAAYGAPWIPYTDSAGVWRNWPVCGCRTDCHCGPELQEIWLPGESPIYNIVSIQVGTETLPDDAYRPDNGNRIVRTDGGVWPDCQDMSKNPGEEDTFAITYRTGLQLDAAAIRAVSSLYCAALKTCGVPGSCGCRIPGNLIRVTRQGVSQEFQDVTELLANGLTGNAIADQWIISVGGGRGVSRSRVYSPDLPRLRFSYSHQNPA